MNILLQKNIWNEYGYTRLINSFIDIGANIQEVNVIPFTETFSEEIHIIPDYIFGSNRFTNICRNLGYPVFKTFDPIERFYPSELWLNSNGYDCKWKDIKIDEPKFIKPYTEKFFTGRIVESQEDLSKVQLATSFISDENEEIVRVSDIVKIEKEIRWFIINGAPITSSFYKINGNVKHTNNDLFEESLSFVKNVLSYGCIDDAFVLDCGLANDEWKIVELNNINSSGIYECNTDAIVTALKYLK